MRKLKAPAPLYAIGNKQQLICSQHLLQPVPLGLLARTLPTTIEPRAEFAY